MYIIALKPTCWLMDTMATFLGIVIKKIKNG